MMQYKDPRLLVQPSPLLKQQMTTHQTMRDLLFALLPVTFAGVWLFGFSALLVVVASILGAVATEWLFSPAEQRSARLVDGSGVLTGLLLGLTLPPALPLWMAFLGGVVSVGIGKLIWGGLGQNLFSPALVGRAFLLATFPNAMTTWSTQASGEGFFNGIPLTLPCLSCSLTTMQSPQPPRWG